MTTIIQLLISALVLGSAYSLVGLGFNLGFATLRVINFAQGQIYMFAGFVFAELNADGWHLVPSLIVALIVGGALGVTIERGIITPIMRRGFTHGNVQAALLGTVAAGIVLTEIAVRIWGADELEAPPLFGNGVMHFGSVILGYDQLTVIVGAALFYMAVWGMLYRSSVGLRIRATSADPLTTGLQGINYKTTISISFLIGGLITAFAGVVVSPLSSVTVASGTTISILGILAALVGGLGRISGAIPAGYAIGIIQVFSGFYISNIYSDLITYLAIFVALVGPKFVTLIVLPRIKQLRHSRRPVSEELTRA
jgi:branched-chain amino acid transport system permease protein